MGDSEYIYAFNKIIMPIVYEFAPDFILVSAGFDAAAGMYKPMCVIHGHGSKKGQISDGHFFSLDHR